MPKAFSVQNVIDSKFKTLDFSGEWEAAVGCPEPTGSWIIYGPPKNGKTTFAMMLVKYISDFRKAAYNSVEEGLSLTIKLAMERTKMQEVGGRVVFWDKYDVAQMCERLDKHKSADVVIIDSVQFLDLKWSEYKRLKASYPKKLFIYISHVEGKQPDGNVAKRILRDANVAFKIEGFRAFPTGRYGGGQPIDINSKLASEYWGLE